MNEGLISKRYAKALFEHAYDLGEETLLYHRMQIMESLWQRMPDLKNSLRSPMIPVETKSTCSKMQQANMPNNLILILLI